jgi:hypothetical protein
LTVFLLACTLVLGAASGQRSARFASSPGPAAEGVGFGDFCGHGYGEASLKRDDALLGLADGHGCRTPPEIATITGHSLGLDRQTLEALPRHHPGIRRRRNRQADDLGGREGKARGFFSGVGFGDSRSSPASSAASNRPRAMAGDEPRCMPIKKQSNIRFWNPGKAGSRSRDYGAGDTGNGHSGRATLHH